MTLSSSKPLFLLRQLPTVFLAVVFLVSKSSISIARSYSTRDGRNLTGNKTWAQLADHGSSTTSTIGNRVSLLDLPEKRTFIIDNYPVRGPLTWTALNEDLKQEFLMHGNMTLRNSEYINNRRFIFGEEIVYASDLSFVWPTSKILHLVEIAKSRSKTGIVCYNYGIECDHDHYAAFTEFPVEGKDVLVVGSQVPWAEAISIAFGAKSVTTVDFNKPVVEADAPIQTMSVFELAEDDRMFDVLISFSSIEHDGLGRYGDPINPNGDLNRMKKFKHFLKKDGHLFLGVPNGKDALFWNAHRIYGENRFAAITEGWNLLKTFGTFDLYQPEGKFSQPVHVLTPKNDIQPEGTPEKRTFIIDTYAVRGPLTWASLNEDLKEEFLMHGNMSLMKAERFNNRWFTHGNEISYAAAFNYKWPTSGITRLVGIAKSRSETGVVCHNYGIECDRDHYAAFAEYPVEGKDVLVVGSQVPWAEAISIAFGAKSVTTVDFNKPEVEADSPIQTMSVFELADDDRMFDVMISFSSIEHDGLGRYGDPINPIGDLERVKKFKLFLKKDGLLFLGVPNGRDTLVWNSHRIYGEKRFSALIQGWKLLDTFGTFDFQLPEGEFTQPVHVLSPE